MMLQTLIISRRASPPRLVSITQAARMQRCIIIFTCICMATDEYINIRLETCRNHYISDVLSSFVKLSKVLRNYYCFFFFKLSITSLLFHKSKCIFSLFLNPFRASSFAYSINCYMLPVCNQKL